MEREKSKTDCYYYIISSCSRGSTCEFRHSAAAKSTSKNCNWWMKGDCDNAKCIYRHPATKKDPSATVCVFYAKGECTKGFTCPFSHSEELAVQTSAAKEEPTPPSEAAAEAIVDTIIIKAKNNEKATQNPTPTDQMPIIKLSDNQRTIVSQQPLVSENATHSNDKNPIASSHNENKAAENAKLQQEQQQRKTANPSSNNNGATKITSNNDGIQFTITVPGVRTPSNPSNSPAKPARNPIANPQRLEEKPKSTKNTTIVQAVPESATATPAAKTGSLFGVKQFSVATSAEQPRAIPGIPDKGIPVVNNSETVSNKKHPVGNNTAVSNDKDKGSAGAVSNGKVSFGVKKLQELIPEKSETDDKPTQEKRPAETPGHKLSEESATKKRKIEDVPALNVVATKNVISPAPPVTAKTVAPTKKTTEIPAKAVPAKLQRKPVQQEVEDEDEDIDIM